MKGKGGMMTRMFTKGTFLSAILVVTCVCKTVIAETLQGTFTFQKRPPIVALVYLPEDTSLSPDIQTVIDQKNKQFKQKLYVVRKGVEANFENSDDINHNIFADDKKAGVKFDIGMLETGGKVVHKIDWENKVVKCGCKIHPKMKTWIASISSQYYQIIEFEKRKKEFIFKMNDFPEHLSKVTVWMPGYDPIELSLEKGESKDVELNKRGKLKGILALARK